MEEATTDCRAARCAAGVHAAPRHSARCSDGRSTPHASHDTERRGGGPSGCQPLPGCCLRGSLLGLVYWGWDVPFHAGAPAAVSCGGAGTALKEWWAGWRRDYYEQPLSGLRVPGGTMPNLCSWPESVQPLSLGRPRKRDAEAPAVCCSHMQGAPSLRPQSTTRTMPGFFAA